MNMTDMICFYIWMIVQIVLESFPISSSGHSILYEQISHVHTTIYAYDYMRPSLIYLLHIPTAIISCIYFFKAWSFPFRHIKRCGPIVVNIIFYTALADIVTVGVYVLIKSDELAHLPLSLGFIITALSLYSLRWCGDIKPTVWDARKAIILGFVQSIAFVPGISRFGLTFVTACWMGIVPRRAFQISLLIHWPLIVLSSSYALYTLAPLKDELLNLISLSVMLGAGIIAYVGVCIVGYMVEWRIMWLWSIYMLIPIIISIVWEV